jgi:DNA repair protein RadC
VQTTQQLVDASKLLGIKCLDHLITGKGCFVSLKEKGLGFGK